MPGQTRVTNRDPLVWRELLGEPLFQSAAFLATQQSEEFDLAATRVWSIAECLKKLGKGTSGAVTFEGYTADRWAIARCSDCVVGTVPITVSGDQTVAAFATRLVRGGTAPVEVQRAVLSLVMGHGYDRRRRAAVAGEIIGADGDRVMAPVVVASIAGCLERDCE